jgi:hypothetical protein
MKKLILILMTIFFIFAITGCPPDDGEKEGREFWALNFKTKKYYKLNAEKLAETPLCEVWAEKGSGVDDGKAYNVANAYFNIYVKMMNNFGWIAQDPDLGEVNTMEVAHFFATDTTNNARLTILLLDIKDNNSASNKAYVGGYFDSINFYDNPNSNKLDMIYVDTSPGKPGSPESNGTIAHEMQHLMNFVSSVAFQRGNVMDTWIDEGLSGAAEWVYSGVHPEVRWKYYNQDQSGLIKKGNNFFIWGNHDDESDYANLDDYATVYLFFQWLRLQSNNSSDIYREIIMSDHYDYRAVIDVAKGIDSGYSNWSLLLRDWLAANYINAENGRYGYMKEKDLRTVKAPMFPGGTTTVNLYPGEGVYSKIESSEILPSSSGYISYAGLGSTIVSSGSASGARLTYNTNTDKTGSSLTGSTTGVGVASIAVSDGNVLSQIAINEFSGPYIVDAGFYLRRNGNINRYDGKSDKILKIDKSKINKVEINE